MKTQNPLSSGDSHPDPQNLKQLRLKRLHDYLEESLNAPDAFQANIGAERSNVMLLAVNLKEALDKALGDASDINEEFERIQPLFNAYCKLTQMSYQLAKLDRRLAPAIQSVAAAPRLSEEKG